MTYIFVFVIGLVLGWVVIPRPKWVKPLFDKLRAKWSDGE